MTSEVLIIGGGVIGLSIARELHKQGVKRITLLEKGSCGEGASWAAAGMLSPQTEADEVSSFFDLCCASRDIYPEFSSELSDETGVDVEFDRSGTLFLAFGEDDITEIRKRFKWQQNAGLSVELLSSAEARSLDPFVSTKVREALFFPNDWQVENRKLNMALRRYAEINGVNVHENKRVEKLIAKGDRVIGATTAAEIFNADLTVFATGAWTSLIKLGDAEMPVEISPVRGQIVAFRSPKPLFRHVICSRRGYLVPRHDGRILAGSTSENAGFDRSISEAALSSLKEMACEISPGILKLPIADHWAGLRPFASDGLPVLGPIHGFDGLFMATGHYRNGILLAPLTARLVADKLVSGKDSNYLKAFGMERFQTQGIGVSS